MATIEVNERRVVQLRLLEVVPSDDWLTLGTSCAAESRSKLFAAQFDLPAMERAQVLYFDLHRLTMWEDVVDPVVTWARCYHKALPAETVPATLVAIGTKVKNEGRRRLSTENVYYLNEGRRSLQRLMGDGDRAEQIFRLIQRLAGSFAMTAVPHHGTATVKVGRRSGAPQPLASDWDAYTKRPPHVDHGEVEALFGMLSKPEDLERDH